MDAAAPLDAIDRIIQAERNERSRKRGIFLLRTRIFGLLLFLAALVFLVLAAWRVNDLYPSLEPGMSPAEVQSILGYPSQRVVIEGDGEIWLYTPPMLFQSAWIWVNTFIPRSGTVTHVATWEDARHPYESISLYFNSERLLKAWVVTGEADEVHSELGDIPGDHLNKYFIRR